MTDDLEYVRLMGEEIKARLFPRSKKVLDLPTGEYVDGPTPTPLPTAIRFQPSDDVDLEVLFISTRTVQWVNEFPADIKETEVRVVTEDGSFVTDLEFGKNPSVTDAENEPLNALLRAVTGTL